MGKYWATSFWVVLLGVACGTTPERPDAKPLQPVAKEELQPKVEVSVEAKKIFSSAVTAYQQQKKSGGYNYEDLLTGFQQALDTDSNLAEAHYNLGCINEAMREDEKAVEHYRKALEIRSDLTLAAANWGALLARQGKLDEALEVYNRALSKDAKNSPVLLNMAAIYRTQKKFDQALVKASEVLVRDPSNVGAYRIMASVYFDKGDLDMAHLICLRGLTVKEKDPRLLNTLGLVLLELKRIPEALAQFRMALDQEPDMIPTRLNVAKIALDYKDFRVARDEFAKILEYEPGNRMAAVGLGIALRGSGEFDAAKKHFETLAGKDQRDPIPHYWLGVLAVRNLNDMKMATTELNKFVELSGSSLPPNHLAFGMLREIGQNVEMEKKMKEQERQVELEAKREEEKQRKLAEMRKKLLDEEWARAEREGDVLPPAKLEGDQLPFVLIPLAVNPAQDTKVKLVGMEFKEVKTLVIGSNYKAKWKQVDNITLEMVVPQGVDLGAWDIQIIYKDKKEDPLIFQGGLWVGEKPKKKPGAPAGQAGEQEKTPKGEEKIPKSAEKTPKRAERATKNKGKASPEPKK